MKKKDSHPAIKILEKYKKIVWPEIKSYLKDPQFPRQFRIPEKYKPLEKYHWSLVSEYPKRKGKYLRPTLLILVAKAMNVNKDKTIKTASAMQVSEEWILNHDDIQDDSPLRRGKPSLHMAYGVELAINAGDALHAVMWKILTDNLSILGTQKTIDIFNEFHKIIMRTTLGQTVDIKWFLENKPDITDEDWFFTADSKSSYYTIAAPTRLGALIADADEKQLDLLAEFGLNLGRSFQLVDDILDVTSNFGGLKQKGNDVYEGKRTVILGHLLRNASSKDKKRLLEILDKPRDKKTEDEVSWVIGMMNDYGSIKYAKDLAKKYKGKAEKIFDDKLTFLSKQPARDELKKIINFILEREH
ncbi:MAG: polyprenyl synthetase family protein [Candidatus Woesebacteria bacterium]|jgi:geranylgeranyl diphosphate synthase type II